MSSKNPYFIGISGGSASGKTYLLKHLLKRFAGDITLISTDNYYRDRDELPRDAEGEINFDHPSAVNLSALADHIERISKGETVEIQEYTFNNLDVVPKTLYYGPSPIVLVEGIFVFHNPKVFSFLDLKLFVNADEHIRLSRRIRRDFEERGYGLDEVLDYYEKYVAPMYVKYIEPYKYECDLVIPNNSKMEHAIDVLANHLQSIIQERK